MDAEKKTAVLGLGALHQVATGDQFEIGHPKGGHWKLTITRVEPGMSHGDLEVLSSLKPPFGSPLPRALMDATLIKEK